MKPEHRSFAKDVAKHLDRRRIRRRIAIYAAIVAAIVLAALYLTCGRGWGLGGKGGGSGSGPGTGSTVLAIEIDAGQRRCSIRVAAAGVTVDGVTATRDQAVATCKATSGADVVVTGDARQGDWDTLEAALEAAGVAIFRREPKSSIDR